MPHKDKEKRKAYQKSYRDKHKNELIEYDRNRPNKEQRAIQCLRKRHQRKLNVLSHYSNGLPTCKQCRNTDMRVLTIDHINGDGAEHRRAIRQGKRGDGHSLYLWLEKNVFPSGFQVLCMNCQWIKRYEDGEIGYRSI